MQPSGDTIVAIATGNARGGIGVIRLSGADAARIAAEIFVPKTASPLPWPNQKLLYGALFDASSDTAVDDGYAVRMSGPNSYTGEEVVEFHLHGSLVVLGEVVRLCTARGARPAAPGEFTRRAFLNGQMDLVQAEAVAELINSDSEIEAAGARRRLEGKLSGALERLRQETISLLAECEADVDFPEEGLSFATHPTLLKKHEQIQVVAATLRASYVANERIHRGFVVAIAGRPNVGKSSLFNALLNQDRAIVTPLPGTTRDVLREEVVWNGRRIRLIDTAGLRDDATDTVERIGVERTLKEAERADRILFVLDATAGVRDDERERMEKFPPKSMFVVWNKIDVEPRPRADFRGAETFQVSAMRGDGLEPLRAAIGSAAAESAELRGDGGISSDRQLKLLDEFLAALDRAGAEFKKGASPEFLAFELREAHRAISRILGMDDGPEDILNEIFSRFCIGK